MAVDKKARGSTLRFVVLTGVGAPQVLADPPEDDAAGGVRRDDGGVRVAT